MFLHKLHYSVVLNVQLKYTCIGSATEQAIYHTWNKIYSMFHDAISIGWRKKDVNPMR